MIQELGHLYPPTFEILVLQQVYDKWGKMLLTRDARASHSFNSKDLKLADVSSS